MRSCAGAQMETYRRMRAAVRRNWSLHVPKTNALWLHYLADTLLTQKKFAASTARRRWLPHTRARSESRSGRPPAFPRRPFSQAELRQLRNFRSRAPKYASACEALWCVFEVQRAQYAVRRRLVTMSECPAAPAQGRLLCGSVSHDVDDFRRLSRGSRRLERR